MLSKRPPPGLLAAPAPKRIQSTAHGGQASVQPSGPLPSPPPLGKRPSMFALFFVLKVKEEWRYNRRLRRLIREENAISQNKALEAFENALQKHLYPIHHSLESFNKRIDVLSHDVEQIKHSNPNGYAYEHNSSEANQENTAVVKVANQEQTAAVAGLTMSEACEGAAVQLRFLNCVKPLVYTERKITAEDGMAIKIAIFRDNEIINSGPLSSARIEIVALYGDFFDVVPDNWTKKEFDGQIVSDRQGPVLGGNYKPKLKNGVVSLDDICFKKVSSKTDSGKLILAARVHGSDKAGRRVKEAVMNPFVVQVSRNESNGKSKRPKLKDEVYRLRGISGTGPRFKMLQENEIYTVEDFLKALNKNEEKIRNEYFKLKKDSKDWEAIVKHAKECDLEDNCKLKSYEVEDKKVILFFNCIYDLVGAKFQGCYITKSNFNFSQQVVVNQLKEDAYEKLDSIQFDHEIKDNYPIPLSTSTNTSIGVEGTATVQTEQCAQINHAPELPNAHNNIGVDKIMLGQSASGPILHEPHCANGYQGNLAGGQMVRDAQVATVQTVQCAQINHAPGLPNAHNNIGADKIMLGQSASGAILREPHCANGYQGNLAGGRMVRDAQVATVQTVQCAQINHAPELPNAHNNIGADKIMLGQSASGAILREPHCVNGYQGNLAGGQMVRDAQVASAYVRYQMAQSFDAPPVITAEECGGNLFVGAIQDAPDLAIDGNFHVSFDLPLDSTQPENQGSATVDWPYQNFVGNHSLEVEASTYSGSYIPQHQFSQDQIIEHPSNAQNDGPRRSAYPGPGYSNC